MSRRFKDILTSEFFFILLAQIIVMLAIVGRGILFGLWYKDYYNIFLAGFVLYLVILILRGLIWALRKMRKRGY